MVDVSKKLSKTLDVLFKDNLNAELIKASLEIQEVIISQYDSDLTDVVTDINSKTNPNLYREEFINRLRLFNYIEKNNGTYVLNVPDMETFDFSGRLKVLESIMNGVSGLYVEVNEEDYVKVFNKKPINEDPVDEYVPPKEQIYLIRYNSKIQRAERELNKKFVRYPFSNMPPIDILKSGEDYTEKNIDRWINDALEKAQKEFVNMYKGVNL